MLRNTLKSRCLIYGILSIIFISFLYISFHELKLSNNRLKDAVLYNDLVGECSFEYNCMQGYNMDCNGIPKLFQAETVKEKNLRESFNKRQQILIKVCKLKNLWHE